MNPPPAWREESPAVFYAGQSVAAIDAAALDFLEARALATPLCRARVCLHRNPDAALHEMVIALGAKGYVRPHRHPDRPESAHVLRGRARLVLFGEGGEVSRVLPLSPPGGGGIPFVRIESPVFHTLLVETPTFVFHETTRGPFSRDASEFADWGPEASDAPRVSRFLRDLWGRDVDETPTESQP